MDYEQLPVLVWTVTKGRCTFVNGYWRSVTGLDYERSAAMGWLQAFHVDDHEKLLSMLAGETASLALRIAISKDRFEWVQVKTLGAGSGEVVFVGVQAGPVFQADVPAALQPEELRELLEEVPAMIWSTKPDGYMDYANSRLLSYYGLSWDEAKGWGWHVGVHPEDWPQLEAKWRAVLADNVAGVNEMRIGDPQRGYRWVTTYGSPTFDASGNVSRWYGVIVDTEDRRNIEEALKLNESYLAQGQALTRTGSIGFDPDWTQTYWSKETFNLLGIDEGIQPSRTAFLKRVHPEDIQQVEEMLSSAKQGVAEIIFQFRIILPGEQVCSFKFLAKHSDGFGNPFYISVIQDITTELAVADKLRQLESDLASVSRTAMMAEVAASIAHEVNQPLAAIIATGGASIRWLDRPQPNIPNARNNLVAIVEQARKANEVVTRVRSLFRKDRQTVERIQVPEMLREVFPLVEHLMKREKVAMDVSICANIPPIVGDKVQIQQVLLNLLLNAIQAMEKSTVKKLHVAIESTIACAVEVKISDTGPGLPEGHSGRIFDAFFTTKETGLGLGLSISRTIVEQHGGEITAENGPSGGATFHLVLPRHRNLNFVVNLSGG
ncbi:PAS domain-containing sensor histidine kinase [Ochrobactrum soli]|uniref:histidine kinase n=1 Tax=Ochrobactrum soli TaxID=2448455 RepID=A0A2P9HE88_9HYPH|nr:ATP-binding protein [[Ochrobactrum] soli]SPL62409.1 Sensory box histidine kinase [[Ochrobactrum] soli]